MSPRSLFLLAATLCASLLQAQNAKPTIMARPSAPTVSLSPAVVQARGKAGQTLTETLTLTNQMSGEFAFDMVAQDVIVRAGKRVFVPAGQLPDSIAQTAVFSQPGGVAKAYSTASVDVRLTIPANTAIRGVVVIFKGSATPPKEKGAVGMVASLGALITFNLSGDVNVAAEPVQVTPASEATNLTIVDRLKNAGSEPAVVSGVAALLDASSKLVGKVPFAAQRLLPGEQLDFTAEYPSELRSGSYRVLCTFEYEGKQFTKTGSFDVR